jgi:hypothetical protein
VRLSAGSVISILNKKKTHSLLCFQRYGLKQFKGSLLAYYFHLIFCARRQLFEFSHFQVFWRKLGAANIIYLLLCLQQNLFEGEFVFRVI